MLILCRMSKHLNTEQLKQHISDGAYVGYSAAAQPAAKQQVKGTRSVSHQRLYSGCGNYLTRDSPTLTRLEAVIRASSSSVLARNSTTRPIHGGILSNCGYRSRPRHDIFMRI